MLWVLLPDVYVPSSTLRPHQIISGAVLCAQHMLRHSLPCNQPAQLPMAQPHATITASAGVRINVVPGTPSG